MKPVILRELFFFSSRAVYPCIPILLLTLFPSQTYAIDIEYGDLYGSFDTTVSYGQSYRAQGVDRDIVAISNAGTVGPTGAIAFPVAGGITGNAFSANFDDGNTNFQSGIISNLAKFTSELDLVYRNTGAFVRFSGFKDFNLDSGDLDRDVGLTDAAERLARDNIDLLDAYARINLDIGKMPFELRVGEQVISWGESTFIQNSINVVNPFDVTKLRVPGSELKEALRPIGVIWGNLGITQNLSLEVFYQYNYEDTELEPVGTFFSTNDFAADGGNRVQLGSGRISDRGSFNFATLTFDPDFLAVFRGPDIRPDEGGQYGTALRLFVPALNDTEFGLFFINYHSRIPVINATTGTAAGVAAGGAAALATAGNALALIGLGFPAATIPTLAGLSAIDAYADTANYFIEFREDIKLYGFGFNTEIGQTGIALQGEYSFRDDVPLQIDDAEILSAAITPLAPVLGFVPSSQLGTFGTATVVPGFIERNVSQVQMTATKIFGPTFKADQAALIGEFAVTHVHRMPSRSRLRLEAPGTFTGGNPVLTAQGLEPVTESSDNFADATSWGYQIQGRLDYLNAIGAINILPRFAWRHDVSGIAPVGLSGFREGNKALTLGVSATYQNEWDVDFSYTNFFGAGRHNLLNDRDFFAFSISYSF
jgi:hypothetical protein